MPIIPLTPGPELDAAVAKACSLPYEFERGDIKVDRGRWLQAFSPSTDLNAAFEAAEKVGLFNYRSLTCYPHLPPRWLVHYFHNGDELNVVAEGPTPALAICAAILALKGEA